MNEVCSLFHNNSKNTNTSKTINAFHQARQLAYCNIIFVVVCVENLTFQNKNAQYATNDKVAGKNPDLEFLLGELKSFIFKATEK